MFNQLRGKRIAILVANGFEQSELTVPKAALEQEAAFVDIVSPELDKVRGWKQGNWGDVFPVDVPLPEANSQDYNGLVLPGGVINPDKLRIDTRAIEFIRHFGLSRKPIAAICHGLWTLINADLIEGVTVTSWPSIKLDLVNAGANWVDQKVVVDKNFVTSRKPEDLPAFTEEMIKLFAKAKAKEKV